jgi:hypothetical protein
MREDKPFLIAVGAIITATVGLAFALVACPSARSTGTPASAEQLADAFVSRLRVQVPAAEIVDRASGALGDEHLVLVRFHGARLDNASADEFAQPLLADGWKVVHREGAAIVLRNHEIRTSVSWRPVAARGPGMASIMFAVDSVDQ